jgi:uncharacterized delta-60 repeat protein
MLFDCLGWLIFIIIFLGFSCTRDDSIDDINHNIDESLPPGELDINFGTAGKTITTFGSDHDYTYAVVRQTDGKLLIAGYYVVAGSNFDFALARYNTNGSLDTTFGTGGKVTTAFGTGYDVARAAAIQDDGKIVAAGYFQNTGGDCDWALARYNTDGSLDPDFGTGGKVTTALGSIAELAYAIAIQTDDKILVAGYTNTGGSNDFTVVRYNTDGSLDTGFDTDGKVTTDLGTDTNDTASTLVIQGDGKILVGGAVLNVNYDSGLVRYNTDGSLDTGFDTDGKLIYSLVANNDYINSLALQTDGKILAAAKGIFSDSDYDTVVVRFNTDGSIDSDFGTNGKTVTALHVSAEDSAEAIIIQSDGKIITGGSSGSASAAFIRYNSTGSYDTTFGTGGTKIITDFGTVSSLVVAADGKIIAVGTYNNGTNDDCYIARIWN